MYGRLSWLHVTLINARDSTYT